MKLLTVAPQIQILTSEFEFSFVRSSGPGGQNVNKVNTKAVLRWNVLTSRSLGAEVRERLTNRLGARLTNEGDLIVMSDRFRDQLRNREDCLEKLKKTVFLATFQAKARKKTKPSFSSQRRVKAEKDRHSQKKRLRRVSRDEN